MEKYQVNLKTKFWEENYEWQHKTMNVIWLYSFFIMINGVWFVWNNYGTMAVMNTIFIGLTYLINRSYNKWSKNTRKE